MNPAIPFYMDLQTTAYHRGIAKSVSTDTGGKRSAKDAVCVVPRSNVYNRGVSVNGTRSNGVTNGVVAINGNLGVPTVTSPNYHKLSRAISQDGRQRNALPQRSREPSGSDCISSFSATLILKEAASFFGNGVQSLVLDNEDTVYSEFTKCHNCYDLIPTSTKLVVFDTQLQVKKAFLALVENGVRAAPLWDSASRQFVGMMTITDFVHILRRYYKSGVVGIKELEEHRIVTLRDILGKDHPPKQFLSMDVKDSLFKAIQTLCDNKLHRLPIIDKTSGNILYLLTHKKILRFLYGYIQDLPAPSFLQRSPKELGIGLWEKIWTVNGDTKLIDALSYFLDKRVSALPVVDDNERLVDIYARADVFDLTIDKSYNNLGITVREALKLRLDASQNVHVCNEHDSLAAVMKVLFEEKTQRVVITNDQLRVVGVVSLSDVLAFLVLRPQSEPKG